MPEAEAKKIDIAKINPGTPDLLPVGAAMQLDSSKFKGTEMGAKLNGFSVGESAKHTKGNSLRIEKVDQGRVRVIAGPTEALSRITTFGLDLGVIGASLSTHKSLHGATLHSAEYNLQAAAGKTAYSAFVGEGELPTSSTQGAENVTKTEIVSASQQASLGVNVGPFKASVKGVKHTADHKSVTNEDGSKDIDNTFVNGERKLEYEASEDPDGETTSELYTITLDNKAGVASLLSRFPNLKVNQKAKQFKLSFTPEQLAELYDQLKDAESKYQARSKKEFGVPGRFDHLKLMLIAKYSKSPTDMVANLHRMCVSNWEQAEVLFRISDMAAGKEGDNRFAALPATVA